jgi:hypothetical protein
MLVVLKLQKYCILWKHYSSSGSHVFGSALYFSILALCFSVSAQWYLLWDFNNFIEKEGSVKVNLPPPSIRPNVYLRVNGGMMVGRAASAKIQISVKSRWNFQKK